MQTMYYIGLDVHKRTISYCVKDGSGTIHSEGTIPATRFDLDRWMRTLPQAWTAAIEIRQITGIRTGGTKRREALGKLTSASSTAST
jgi:predicted NBD/HSP70 family sugar kinase